MKWQLWIIIAIAFIAFAFSMNARITPEMYRNMAPPLGYIFIPDDDTFVNSDHRLEVSFVRMGREIPTRVTAHIARHPYEDTEELDFEILTYAGEPTSTWFAILPPLPNKADRWFYYITIETSENRTIELWKRMNWFEKLFTGFKQDRRMFWVTYEGNIVREVGFGRLILVSHIVLSLGALLFMFHALYYMMCLFSSQNGHFYRRTWYSLLGAWITFFVGTMILGPPITWYTFADGFAPWPVRGFNNLGDITDTKSVLLVVWWGILLLTTYKNVRLSRTGELTKSAGMKFAWWTLLAIIITVLVFLIPHSQFIT
ncbi:MAG TPA: hypothetical protein ENN67_06055 [Firmicutes bacterium]|nr:hypothetical protein [Bacillota bacterium]